ncbi:MAG TPA: ABC transporter substrate-binding protein [Thermoleophilaceae bacterium]|nr:ABC transporter substrate-binding protein [Thermoleophilaceae bacterium]
MGSARAGCLLALAALAATAVGCSDDAEPRVEAGAGGSIVVAEASPPGSLDPALVTTATARRAAWLAYTPPLTYRRAEGEDGTDLVPALAEELPETSDDGRSYSFRLRPGLRYSDARVVRASDFERAVARSLRLSPRGIALWGDVVGARAYARGEGGSTDIRGIAVDDRTGRVRIELENPDRLFRYALASLAAAPVPPGTPLRDLSDDPPPGVGPYRVAQVRRGGDVVLERRRDWSLPGIPAGNAQQIVTRTIPDRAVRVDAVVDGRADLVEGESPQRMLPDIRSSYKSRYAEYPTLRGLYVSIDASRAPFRDGDVRRALSYALDARVLAQLHDGFMQPACNMLPPVVAGYRALDPCPYGERDGDADLVEASRLVEDAGAAGARVRVADGSDPRGRRLARYLATTLRKIGLSARVVRGGDAQVAFAASQPAIPHPAAYLDGVDDPVLAARVELLEQQQDAEDAEQEWAAVDEDVVSGAYGAPYGVATAGVLASKRLDMLRCARFHPVVGMDYSSVCLR